MSSGPDDFGDQQGLLNLANAMDLPDGAIPMFGIAGVVFMTASGRQAYRSSFVGEERGTSFLGFLEYMKGDIMDWRHEGEGD